MSELPPPEAGLADQLMGLARLVETEGEIAARPGQLDRLDAIANRLRALSGLQSEPIDWPARFRAAADEVEKTGQHSITVQRFDDMADRLESGLLPPHVAEAIGRALLGEAS